MTFRSRAKALIPLALATAAAAGSALAATETLANPGSGGGIGPDSGSGSASDSGGRDGTFPVRGRHSYGDGLGAGRGHQGQDLLAKCGTPVVAATAGRVRVEDYQAAGAGNFVVVSARKAGDYVYMHMLGDVAVSEGERVQAGDPIGRVGTTGSSSACHLHFEMWTAPGWYEGGRVTDPTPNLKDWDREG